ncbi:hypothetical protein HPB49_013282 [Dermacentor silvarum]|uniref:Uncharacterized protein n=1 Tax=Dermacentor silvarum TaxID=543639 RepID=A0ACB8E0D3_DERSI|nr:hypothetical protein HPB49_013282 [Dermacentor silvarum]
MGPRSGRRREPGVHLVCSYPNVCPAVHQLFSNLSCMQRMMGQRRVNLNKPCTASTVHGCLQLTELSLRNNFLWVINIELHEGRLAGACLRGRVVPVASNMQHQRSFFLVHWPLMHRRSTEFVQLRESRRRPKQFRGDLELSGNLRHARLGYHLLLCLTRDLMDALRSAVTTLDMLAFMSMRFSCVGVIMVSELLNLCDAMGTLVFLESWIDVPEAQALLR